MSKKAEEPKIEVLPVEIKARHILTNQVFLFNQETWVKIVSMKSQGVPVNFEILNE